MIAPRTKPVYNNRFRMQDLFMNPKLASVIPQFDRSEPLRNVYSNAKTVDRVQKYLVGVLNAAVTGKRELTVNGKHKTVMSRVQRLQPVIENLFNGMPTVVKGLRANTRLYTPFASIGELENIKGFPKRLSVIKAVMDNIMYNPDFQSKGNASPAYIRRQELWKKKVGYKEKE